MSANKQLKIGVKSDLREGEGLVKFLNELAATGNKVAKSLQSINLGSAGQGAQRGALAKAVLEQKSLFNDLGKAGTDLARIMKDQVGKSTEELDRKLEDTNKRLKAALDLHKQFSQQLTNTKQGTQASRVFGNLVNEAQGDVEKLLGEKSAIQSANGALKTGNGKGSIWTRDLAPGMSQIPGVGGLSRFAGPAAIAGLAINGIVDALTSAPARGNHFLQNQADTGGILGQMALPTAKGDPTMAWAMQNMLKDPAMRKDLVERLAKERTSAETKSVMGLVKNFNVTSNFDSMLNGVVEGGTSNVAVKAALLNQLQMYTQANPMAATQLQEAQARAGGHLAAGRRMGSMGDVNWAVNQGKWSGMDEGQVEGVAVSIVDRAGRSASRRLRDVALRAVIGGMQDASSIAGATATDRGLMSRLGGTGFDVSNQSVLGQAVAAGMSPLSMSSQGSSRLAALSFGIAPGMDSADQRRLLEQNIAGDQSLGSLFGGHDPYQKTLNLTSAISHMGAGSSIYGQNALATSLKDTNVLAAVMSGQVPGYLQDLGITKGAAQATASDILNSQLNRVIQDPGTAATAAGRAAQDALDSGDVRGFIRQNPGQRRALASALAYSNESMFPGGPAQAEGMVREIGGLGTSMHAGGWGDGGYVGKDKDGKGIPGLDLSLLQTQLSQVAENFNKIRLASEAIGQGEVPALRFIQSFQRMVESLQGLTVTPEGMIEAFGVGKGLFPSSSPVNPQAKPTRSWGEQDGDW